MRTSTLGVALLTAVLVALACGGPQRGGMDQRKNEITALWTQIRDWRLESGLQVDPRVEDFNQVIGTPVKDVQRVCPENHPVPQVCSDVCSLAEAICDNAEQICILADQLGKNDSWAQDKCTSAKASCREAKKKCCAKCSETKSSWLTPPAKTTGSASPVIGTPK